MESLFRHTIHEKLYLVKLFTVAWHIKQSVGDGKANANQEQTIATLNSIKVEEICKDEMTSL